MVIDYHVKYQKHFLSVNHLTDCVLLPGNLFYLYPDKSFPDWLNSTYSQFVSNANLYVHKLDLLKSWAIVGISMIAITLLFSAKIVIYMNIKVRSLSVAYKVCHYNYL